MFKDNLKNFIANSENLNLLEDNIWCIDQGDEVCYPEFGSDYCFNIEDNSYWFKHRNDCIIAILKKLKKSNEENYFFDIGGGNGFVSKAIQSIGFEPILIEPSLQGARNAGKRGIKNIICSTFNDIEFKPNSVPFIGLFDVLEHIENDIQFLSKISDVIKDDGYLVLTVPAHKYLWSNEDVLAGHFRRYSLKSLGKKLEEEGFKIKYSSYIFPFFSIPIFLFRTLPSFFGFKKKTPDFSNMEKEHKERKGIMQKLLNFIFSKDLKNISNEKKGHFGTSCLIVAQFAQNIKIQR